MKTSLIIVKLSSFLPDIKTFLKLCEWFLSKFCFIKENRVEKYELTPLISEKYAKIKVKVTNNIILDVL